MITVYSTENCVACNASYRKLDDKGIDYTVVNLTAEPDRLKEIAHLGYNSAPVIIAGDQHWSGYRPDRLAALAQEFAAA
jgi:glutaredoxin-like protein NrdH